MKKKINSIGIIGDMHFKDDLSYADYISDRRVSEKQNILDFVVKSFEDCKHIVFLGDNLNSRNNSSETNRSFVEFIERFGDKDIYIISGNHEKKGDGKTAIDFLGEVKKPNWHVLTKPSTFCLGDLEVDFLPYMLNRELGVETTEEAVDHILKELGGGDILFTHHCISGTVFNGIKTEDLKEIVLPKEKVEEMYELAVAGHIHAPQQYGKVLITGNVFTTEVGEKEKFIYKIDENLKVEKIHLPIRQIHKLENPSIEDLLKIPVSSIVKVVLSNKEIDFDKLEEHLLKFDAHLIIENYPSERKKAHIEEGAFDFSLEAVLKLYAEAKKIDHQKLLKGLHIING